MGPITSITKWCYAKQFTIVDAKQHFMWGLILSALIKWCSIKNNICIRIICTYICLWTSSLKCPFSLTCCASNSWTFFLQPSFSQGIQIKFRRNMTSSVEGGRVRVIFGREGYSFGNISVRITPLTYDQFEARGYDLDNFFPARPPAASSKRLYTQNLIVKVWWSSIDTVPSVLVHVGSLK